MKYVLDTNAFSALMQGQAAAVDRLAAVSRGDVSVPQPVLAEIAYGIERLPHSRRRLALQERFDLLRSQLLRCPWTDEVSALRTSMPPSPPMPLRPEPHSCPPISGR